MTHADSRPDSTESEATAIEQCNRAG